ncbi:MAG: radical SAM protein, partial [Candidatus Aenigmatarchaeota archaeon]
TPYHSAVYVIEGSVAGSVNIHPSSFYPGSPFDTFKAIEQFYTEGTLTIPRFYLYPTAMCNSRCSVCQFTALDRFKGKTDEEKAIPYETVEKIIDEFYSMGSGLRTISAIISGDGEPTEHPDISRILDTLKEKRMRVFLTSNLRLPKDTDGHIMRSIVDDISMMTVSIKGLNIDSYDRHQGTTGGVTFGKVLDNLERLVSGLEQSGRREEVLLGVGTLLLPENAGSYTTMIDRFVQLGIDYVYINPVGPTYAKWGIMFTESQQRSIQAFLDSLSSIDCGRTVIRYPGTLALDNPDNNVYYDARNRRNIEVCGSALLNPTIVTTDTDGKAGARILSCRSSQNFRNSNFWYVDGWIPAAAYGAESTHHRELYGLLSERLQGVMNAASGCTDCRLERQVKTFDRVITLMKEHKFKGRFMLEFNVDELVPRGRAITFEETNQ